MFAWLSTCLIIKPKFKMFNSSFITKEKVKSRLSRMYRNAATKKNDKSIGVIVRRRSLFSNLCNHFQMKKLILLLLAFAGSINFTYAQWQQTNGPHTGSAVTCIAVSGTNIFAGTGGGVFLSTDSGTTWIAVNNGLTDTIIIALTISGTNIFAGTQDSGVYLSKNNGASWTAVNYGLLSLRVTSLAASGTNIFAGTIGGNVWISTTMGSNWNINTAGAGSVSALAIIGTNILGGTANGYVYLSTDTGSTWTELSNVPGQINSFAMSGTNIFVGSGGGVYLSTDTGLTWTAVNSGLLNTNVNSLIISGTNIFAGTAGGVFLSTNTIASSWTAVNNGLTDSTIFSLAVMGTYIFAGTDTAGVWKSSLSDILKCAPVINASSAIPFPCGGSVTLSNSIGSGFLWSDGETTQNIVVTTAGNYSCNVTTDCGTITSNIISVAIAFNRKISASGPRVFCEGGSVTLTVSNGSGYLWSNGETTQSIVMTSTLLGIRCIITTPCGIDTVGGGFGDFVAANPLPVATITPGGTSIALCQGEMISVANDTSYYNSYINSILWSNGATTQSITVSAPQTDSVTITDANGCSATSSTTITAINPLPSTPVITASGATTFCDGDSVMLTSSAATGYNWSNGATTQSIAAKSTTSSYTVIVINANGCSSASPSNAISVVVHSTPVPPTIHQFITDSLFHQFNDSLVSSDSTGNQWYLNGAIISGATGQFYVVTQNGIYTDEYTNGNGCSSTSSAPFNFTTFGVGVIELTSDYSFIIYPNPANQSIVISLQSAVNPVAPHVRDNGVNKKTEITIIDVLGKKVYSEQSAIVNPQSEISIDVSALSPGIYFVMVVNENGRWVGKFVKE